MEEKKEDFFMAVNKKWLAHTKIPSYRATYGISEQLEESIEKELLGILRKASDKTKIGKLVHSVLNDSVQIHNVEKIKQLLKDIDCMKTTDDLCFQLGLLNKYQLTSPLNILINHDVYNSSKCLIHLFEPELGLPTYNHYTKDDSDSVLVAYKTMLKKIGDELESHDLEHVLPIEKQVYDYLSNEGDLDDPTISHNEFKLEKLENTYKHINWSKLFESYGIKIKKSDVVIVTNMNYINQLDKMFQTFDMKVWSIWLRAYSVLSLLKYLPPPFDDFHYALFGKELRGELVKLPQPKLLLHVFDNFANQSLSSLYVHSLKDALKIKNQATLMVNGLKNATLRLIQKSSWMSVNAKRMAMIKIKKMIFQVGFNSKLLDYDVYSVENDQELKHLEISDKCLIENILALSEKKTVDTIKRIGFGCEKFNTEWDDGAYEVNAYYYADQNKMVIPLGILQSPFFDKEKSVAWNYGGIGAAIGHEITHAFDEDGHHYDQSGSWKDWWTTADKHKYSEITEKVEKLYDGLKYMDGHVNGHLTLDENLADIGGLEIALEALDYAIQTTHIVDDIEKKKMYDEFFVSFAMSWRLKDRPKKAKQSLILDRHAPAYYRVNRTLGMFDTFYDTYNVNKKNSMYIKKEDRVHLFY